MEKRKLLVGAVRSRRGFQSEIGGMIENHALVSIILNQSVRQSESVQIGVMRNISILEGI